MKNDIAADTELTGLCDFDIRILKDGTWIHDGRAIRRAELVRLFASVLMRDDNGQHWLVTPAERGRIEVEDAAFVSCALKTEGGGRGQMITVTTNTGRSVPVNADYPLILKTDGRGDAVPYVRLDKNLEMRIARNHFYELAGMAESDPEDENWMGFWSGGLFHRIGRAV